MLKALLWKEWREQRQIAFAGLAVTFLVPALVIVIGIFAGGSTDFLELSDMIPFLLATLVWPLFAALAGATTNAEEMRIDAAAFLFSKPVSRIHVWAVKLTTALIAITFIVSVSYLVAQLIEMWLGGPGFRFPFSSDPVQLSMLGDAGVRAAAVGVVLVSFAGSVLFSTLL